MPDSEDLILKTMQEGDIKLEGQFLNSSNYTFLVNVSLKDHHLLSIYKPTRGERPLWDFPAHTLTRREVAAYHISHELGWNLVPLTIYRKKGPLGAGSLQIFIDHDPQYHYFNFSSEDKQRLRPVAVFDMLVNNADRKGGHILRDAQQRFWIIDHGICFHVEDKLRTVIWDFAGEQIPAELLIAVKKLNNTLNERSGLYLTLRQCLKAGEIKALSQRAKRLLEKPFFPEPSKNYRPYPWPPV